MTVEGCKRMMKDVVFESDNDTVENFWLILLYEHIRDRREYFEDRVERQKIHLFTYGKMIKKVYAMKRLKESEIKSVRLKVMTYWRSLYNDKALEKYDEYVNNLNGLNNKSKEVSDANKTLV